MQQCKSFNGKTSTLQELSDIRKVNDDAHKPFVFLISTRAGGVGLNLAGADMVAIPLDIANSLSC